jgi:hypothetical protein
MERIDEYDKDGDAEVVSVSKQHIEMDQLEVQNILEE